MSVANSVPSLVSSQYQAFRPLILCEDAKAQKDVWSNKQRVAAVCGFVAAIAITATVVALLAANGYLNPATFTPMTDAAHNCWIFAMSSTGVALLCLTTMVALTCSHKVDVLQNQNKEAVRGQKHAENSAHAADKEVRRIFGNNVVACQNNHALRAEINALRQENTQLQMNSNHGYQSTNSLHTQLGDLQTQLKTLSELNGFIRNDALNQQYSELGGYEGQDGENYNFTPLGLLGEVKYYKEQEQVLTRQIQQLQQQLQGASAGQEAIEHNKQLTTQISVLQTQLLSANELHTKAQFAMTSAHKEFQTEKSHLTKQLESLTNTKSQVETTLLTRQNEIVSLTEKLAKVTHELEQLKQAQQQASSESANGAVVAHPNAEAQLKALQAQQQHLETALKQKTHESEQLKKQAEEIFGSAQAMHRDLSKAITEHSAFGKLKTAVSVVLGANQGFASKHVANANNSSSTPAPMSPVQVNHQGNGSSPSSSTPAQHKAAAATTVVKGQDELE